MEVTEVRIFRKETGDKKLRAFATITFDNQFVVRDIKVIEGAKGLFVAMPSRKAKVRCTHCGHSNFVGGRFCGWCAKIIEDLKIPEVVGAQSNEHRDIAHPITLECREYIQKKVLEAYEQELKRPSLRASVSEMADD